MTLNTSPDAVVIGAGIIGCAIAYELQKAGVQTLIVEAAEIASGASGASAGGVRQQNRDLREIPLAIDAISMWSSLSHELSADLEYHQDGHLMLAENEEEIPELEARVARERELGLDDQLIYPDELEEIAPGISDSVVAATWCPTDGHANPITTNKAFCNAAIRLGASVVENTEVTNIVIEEGSVEAVVTTQETISCSWVINAAGMGSRKIAGYAGIEIPIINRAPQMIITSKGSHQLLPVLGATKRNLSLKQLPNGTYLIGGGWPGTIDKDELRAKVKPDSVTGSVEAAYAMFPPIATTNVVRSWVGVEAVAADQVPIIGECESVRGFLLACGFSGHGFALAPSVGTAITELVTTGNTPERIRPLSINRFDHSELTPDADDDGWLGLRV